MGVHGRPFIYFGNKQAHFRASTADILLKHPLGAHTHPQTKKPGGRKDGAVMAKTVCTPEEGVLRGENGLVRGLELTSCGGGGPGPDL